MNINRFLFIILLLSTSILGGCLSTARVSQDNICTIFEKKPKWYRSSVKAADRWNSNVAVPMAIMAQESSFKARAKPPMRFFLGVIPYGRASNAYGYPQALDSTWASYKREAGSILSRRDFFSDAIDFIQWYMHNSTQRNKVTKTDAYAQYLNYHEGQGGYARGTYKNKAWLVNTARRVEKRAQKYAQQYQSCAAQLRRDNRWKLF
ncbi:MAG: transglycosylase SLT domain-containing protein [Arenicellales bacterium]